MLLGLQGCVFSTGPPPSANAWAALGSRATDMVCLYRGALPFVQTMGPRACAGAALAWRDVSVALRRTLLCAMRAGRHGEIAARGGATEERQPRRSSGGLGLLVLRFGWLYGSSPVRS